MAYFPMEPFKKNNCGIGIWSFILQRRDGDTRSPLSKTSLGAISQQCKLKVFLQSAESTKQSALHLQAADGLPRWPGHILICISSSWLSENSDEQQSASLKLTLDLNEEDSSLPGLHVGRFCCEFQLLHHSALWWDFSFNEEGNHGQNVLFLRQFTFLTF